MSGCSADALHLSVRPILIPPFVLLLFATFAIGVRAQELPDLNWIPRSDWISVRTSLSPPAVGNGVADDTPALQAALDQLGANPGEPNTVYLPPGTYRISKTLVVKQK